MKPGPNERLQDHTATADPHAADRRPRTLFIHVPKSGGTTLDGIFRDHFFDTPLYPPVGPNKLGSVLEQLRDPASRYVGGHYPIGTVAFDAFDRKVTILRKPLDVICSRLSFKNKLANEPPERLSPLELSGRQMQIYERYYSPHFDRERCELDARHGEFFGVQHYVPATGLKEVIEQFEKFDDVLDFGRLDDEIKYFLIRNDFFPYRGIQKKRAYSYDPDHDRAKKLLCEFDRRFYETASRRFREIPSDIEHRYERYRADYCESRGLALQVHEGRSLDLRAPLGSGWFNVEPSEAGTPFRWSEDQHATVEIPVAHAGVYAVQLHVTAAVRTDFRLTASTTQEAQAFPVTEVLANGVRVFTARVSTRSHDWIHLDIEFARTSERRTTPQEGDVRALGVALGHVHVARQPAGVDTAPR